MATAIQDEQDEGVSRTAKLLGGPKILKLKLNTTFDAHELILVGFPSGVLTELSKNVAIIRRPDTFEKALGLSLRTFQRRKKDAASKRLSQEQSGRAWKFAEIVEKATEVFGTQAAAEQFLEEPQIGLNQQRPIDLIATPAGIELVETHLERIKYGVYA